MGLFNTLTTEIACPNCKENCKVRIQYKFGMTYLFEYKIGDTIKWQVYNIGHPGIPKVKAYGVIESDDECPFCKTKLPENYDIIIEKDVIINVFPTNDISDYIKVNEEYIVLD